MKRNHTINYSYRSVPTIKKFAESNAFVRGIRGPVGSGKSTGCLIEIIRRANMQAPDSTGIRRTRWAIIRNTYPQLRDTTIKTVHDWLPPDIFGQWRAQEHVYVIDKFQNVEIELLFRALDRPDQVANLLSLELTGAWINEAREVPKEVLDALTGRVGRYPSRRNGGCTWSGIIMDTNAPTTRSWWYDLAERETPEDWEFFSQPSGLSPEAENLDNLPENYYQRISQGKTDDWINVYVHNNYGSIADGKPVYAGQYNDAIHVSNVPLWPLKGKELTIGLDFGLTPAAVIGQINATGQLRILEEIISPDSGMGIRQFMEEMVLPVLQTEKYRHCVQTFVGDPAGGQRSQTDGKTAFDVLKELRVTAYPASTNNAAARWEAVRWWLTQLRSGDPAFLLDPSCEMLREGFISGYRFRRLNTAGERYAEKADKNEFSHCHDALQYLCDWLKPNTLYKKETPMRRVTYHVADSVVGY